LSIKLNQLPPLTPLTSAETMRSVQIEASIHDQSRISASCLVGRFREVEGLYDCSSAGLCRQYRRGRRRY